MRKSGLMKKAVVLGLTVAMALGTMVTANAADAKVWKYTFHDGTGKQEWMLISDSMTDWIQANDQVYDPAVGYGFDEANTWGAGTYAKREMLEGGIEYDINDPEQDALFRATYRAVSAAKGDTEVNFYVDLEPGTYDITVYAGGISDNSTYDYNKIYIQGKEVVRDYAVKPFNSSGKAGSPTLTLDDIAVKKTITLTKKTKVEIKASNPSLAGSGIIYSDGKEAVGGRAYMNAVVIEEVKADSNVPKTGVVSSAVVCGAIALAGAGVAVITRKKED